jgi:hypothetical protein
MEVWMILGADRLKALAKSCGKILPVVLTVGFCSNPAVNITLGRRGRFEGRRGNPRLTL